MSLLESFKKLGNYFGAYKVHLCSEVKGQVSENGKPLIVAYRYYSKPGDNKKVYVEIPEKEFKEYEAV